MKLLLACFVALFASVAGAQTLAVPNGNGGEIVLTALRPCPQNAPSYLDGRIAFTYGEAGVLRGCWRLVDETVFVAWEDGDERRYALERFNHKEGI